MVATTPTTAADLFAALKPFGPAVIGTALVFDREPPPEVRAILRVLHSGIRALLTGRPWWGSASTEAKRAYVAVLRIDEPLPVWCGLLCVEGDTRWDRINPVIRLDFPNLFAGETQPQDQT